MERIHHVQEQTFRHLRQNQRRGEIVEAGLVPTLRLVHIVREVGVELAHLADILPQCVPVSDPFPHGLCRGDVEVVQLGLHNISLDTRLKPFNLIFKGGVSYFVAPITL